MKDFLLENSLRLAGTLLKNQPPNVQYSATLLAARLNAKTADQNKRIPAQPYPASQKFLMGVMLDEQMPISARIIAVNGLNRLMRDGDISTVEKSNIGVALADALRKQKIENPLARKWYRWKIVEALGNTGRYEETGYRPVMIDALMSVIVNRQDDWEVRAAAARAASQLPLDGKVNIELVNYEIVRLLAELATAYNASDRTPPSTWKWAFDSIYLAYKSPTKVDQDEKHWGLMHLTAPRGREQIQSAYKVVLKVVKPVMEAQVLAPVNAADLKGLNDWLANNKVADRKVTSQSEPLPEPAGANGAAPPPRAAVEQTSSHGQH